MSVLCIPQLFILDLGTKTWLSRSWRQQSKNATPTSSQSRSLPFIIHCAPIRALRTSSAGSGCQLTEPFPLAVIVRMRVRVIPYSHLRARRSRPGAYSRSASRNGRDPGNTIIPEGFSLLSPKRIRGYTPYQIGVLGSRTPLDNLRRMDAFVGEPRRAPLAGSPNPGNSNG